MESFIGDDECVWILTRPLHLLLCTASWVGAPVVAPILFYQYTVQKQKLGKILHRKKNQSGKSMTKMWIKSLKFSFLGSLIFWSLREILVLLQQPVNCKPYKGFSGLIVRPKT